jgi:exodeoxyribonuclease VII small subunit
MFEEKLKRLEEIVDLLEKSELNLEKSVELYSEGVKLSAECKKEIEEAQLKITQK